LSARESSVVVRGEHSRSDWFDQVEILSGSFDDQRVAVFKFFPSKCAVVHESKIYAFTGFFIDASRHSDVVRSDSASTRITSSGVSTLRQVSSNAEIFFQLSGLGH